MKLKIKQILEGISNTVFKTPEIELVAEARMDICKKCPLLDVEGSKCMIPGTAPCCGDCGCKLAFKTRSLSSECTHPDGPKWNAVLSPEEEDKLYKELNYNPNDQKES